MAFRKKCADILALKPDLLIVIECEHADKLTHALEGHNVQQILWFGDNPHKGIAIVSFVKTNISLYKKYDPEFRYVIPLVLHQSDPIFLFIIWAMPHETIRSRSYVGQIWAAIQHYTQELNSPSLLIGDFNSNAIWDKSKKHGNHTDVVNFLNVKGIISLYHHLTEEEPGKELIPTLYMYRHLDKPYHMDYCFVSQQYMSTKTKFEIGSTTEWIDKSDHMPLFIEIDI